MGFLNGLRLSARRLVRTRAFRNLILIFAVYTFLDALRIQRIVTNAPRHDPKRPRKLEKVYIAGMHYNSAGLIKNHWNKAVLDLVDALGRENVFVSVYESGSWDDSKKWLAELDDELWKRGVRRNVVLDERTHQQEVEEVPAEGEEREGWIVTPRGKKEMRRIPFLAKLRNLTLKDLWALSEKGESFDKILFLNDVVFTTEDVLALLDTNRGLYAAACSLDFSQPPYYYDTFALRDTAGQAHLMQTWPYFRSQASRDALMAYSDAVPVRSCWNGIVAMPAAPFLAPESKRLKFRAAPDSLAEKKHLEASECCLIHIDNPLSEPLGVFLNPRVRVAYDGAAYEATHPADPSDSWLSVWRIVVGVWESRLRRWFSTDGVKEWVVKKRVGDWEAMERGNVEKGVECLINEGQVLVYNGWAHV
ncbi:polysaccharide export protein [Colletotrichum truncatum]|uniref:Polysaccharide export protein n=1 Tax=Colletotrichum truncatum TaxID=5467 RepID=A0ACC3Z588_COLTU|nr:polysaccharide export protein [Colletotrichum truncatum]KAF6795143.1 polysaccharide export protein [Colletotrichum truncatum]